MHRHRLAFVPCFVVLFQFVASATSRADDPGWSGTISNPAGNTVAVGPIQVSGTFSKQGYSPSCDFVRITITKMGAINPTYFNGSSMTNNGPTSTPTRLAIPSNGRRSRSRALTRLRWRP